MIFSKTSLNTLDILFLVNSIKAKIINSYLSKAYLTKVGLFLKLRKQDDLYFLLIDPEGWILITNSKPEENLRNEFIKILRSKLENKRLLDIKMPYFDRYLILDFEDSFQLHVEFMRGGNVILTQNGVIIENLKGDHYRFKPGSPYENKELNKFNFLEIDLHKIKETLKESKGNLVASFWRIFGIPPEISTEACLRLNVDKNLLPSQLEDSKLEEIIFKIKQIISEYLQTSKPNIVLSDAGEYESIENIELEMFKNNNKIYFNEFNDAIENYFFKLKEYKIKKDIETIIQKDEEKKRKIIEDLNKNLAILMNENNKLKILIDKFKSNFLYFDNFMNKINDAILRKDWEKVKNEIANEWNKEFGEIQKIDLKEKNLILKFEDIIVNIDLKKSASHNLNTLYERIKDNNNKINRINEKILELSKIEKKEVTQKITLKEVRRKYWYENFLWFFTSNGFLAVAGRDSSQNETLIKKRTEKNDIVFHADIHGSPFLVLKTKGKKVEEKDLNEAAQFVACYSSSWRAGLTSIDVYWVMPDQVSKQAPSGLYLAKGSFMIYGKKNYIKNVPLELAVKINENGDISIMPFIAVKEGRIIKLIPGTNSKEKIIEKIIKAIKEFKINIKEKEIRELLEKNLPKGEFDLRIEVLPKNK